MNPPETHTSPATLHLRSHVSGLDMTSSRLSSLLDLAKDSKHIPGQPWKEPRLAPWRSPVSVAKVRKSKAKVLSRTVTQRAGSLSHRNKSVAEIEALEGLIMLKTSSSLDSISGNDSNSPSRQHDFLTGPSPCVALRSETAEIENAARVLVSLKHPVDTVMTDQCYMHPQIEKMMDLSLEELALASSFETHTPQSELPPRHDRVSDELDDTANEGDKQRHVEALKRIFTASKPFFTRAIETAERANDMNAIALARMKRNQMRSMAKAIHRLFPDERLPGNMDASRADPRTNTPTSIPAAEPRFAALQRRLAAVTTEIEGHKNTLADLKNKAITTLNSMSHSLQMAKKQRKAALARYADAIKARDLAVKKVQECRERNLQDYLGPVEDLDGLSIAKRNQQLDKWSDEHRWTCDELGEAMSKVGCLGVQMMRKDKESWRSKTMIDDANRCFLADWGHVYVLMRNLKHEETAAMAEMSSIKPKNLFKQSISETQAKKTESREKMKTSKNKPTVLPKAEQTVEMSEDGRAHSSKSLRTRSALRKHDHSRYVRTEDRSCSKGKESRETGAEM